MHKILKLSNREIEVHDNGDIYLPQRISTNGHTIRRKKIKLSKKANGYVGFTIWNPVDGKGVGCLHHRILARAFLRNFDENLVVDHIDGNKSNNDLSNLRMLTHRENIRIYWTHQREALGLPLSNKKNNYMNPRLLRKGKQGFFGVHEQNNEKFIAQIRVGKSRVSGGMFANPVDAACAANKLMLDNNFELTRINIPLMPLRISSFQGSKNPLSMSFCDPSLI